MGWERQQSPDEKLFYYHVFVADHKLFKSDKNFGFSFLFPRNRNLFLRGLCREKGLLIGPPPKKGGK